MSEPISPHCGGHTTTTTTLPVCGIDPIADESTALGLVLSLIDLPLADQHLAVLLDRDHVGIGVVGVAAPAPDDAVLDLAAVIATAVEGPGNIAAAILVSVRPDRSTGLDDADRWLALDDELASADCELVEWFVLGRDISRPRELIGDAERWRGRPGVRARRRRPCAPGVRPG